MAPGDDAALRSSAAESPLLLASDQVARQLGISRSSVWKLHSAGQLPAPIRLGRRTLWCHDTLRAWVRAGSPSRARWEAMSEGAQ